MKLTFKDLKQQKFSVDAEPTETIGQVKEKISKEKGWEVALQKLIYSGKILQDQNTVESYHIEEKGFIVCMVSKPKAVPAPVAATATAADPPSTPAPAVTQTPSAPAAPAPASSSGAAVAPGTPSPAPAASTEPPSFNDPSALALGSQRDAAIANMESMGFPRSEIDRAMRAAFFNPDRAVEYLISGIPESVQQQERPSTQPTAGAGQTSAQTTSPAPTTGTAPAPETSTDAGDQPINLFEAAAQAGRGSGGARTGGTAGSGSGTGAAVSGAGAAGALGNLEFLRNNPQFQQLRQVVQQQPHMLEPILQQVSAGNPQLAQLIGQHPDQFLQLLSENVDDDGEIGGVPGSPQSISVTEEERDAIERLCRLGFERNLVIQAYFACDKNEELAANFLFDQPDDAGDE